MNYLTGLDYISDSPSRKNGGFHPAAVDTAKQTLAVLRDIHYLVLGHAEPGHECDLCLVQALIEGRIEPGMAPKDYRIPERKR